jgi:CDP-4-dehydro-6-deoxyglucose reductase, E1
LKIQRGYIRVPYGQTVHGEEEISAVLNVLHTSTQMGPRVAEFEDKVAALFAKRHGIMVNSGSSANYLAVEILGLKKGSEVITPALTFSTTIAPIVRNGLIPALVDVEEDTYNIDVTAMEEAVTEHTSAIMVPSLIGNLPQWDAIWDLASRKSLFVIEDSADTLGARLCGRSTGTRSDISTTSFYGSHVINCAGNGGMLCVNEDGYARRARLLRSWGRSSSLFVDSEKIENRFEATIDGVPYDAKFVFEELGYNLEPSELGAAFGLVQLSKLKKNIQARIENFARHLAFFAAYEDWFILPRQIADSYTGWLAFPLTVRDGAPFQRRDLQVFLENRNIQTRTVFTGNVLRQPLMKGVNVVISAKGYKNADAVMKGGILIACHHGLREEQIEHMHSSFCEFAKQYGRV